MLRNSSDIVVEVFIGRAVAPNFIDGFSKNASSDQSNSSIF